MPQLLQFPGTWAYYKFVNPVKSFQVHTQSLFMGKGQIYYQDLWL